MRIRVLPSLIFSIVLLIASFMWAFHRMHQTRMNDVRQTTAQRAADLTQTELRNYVDLMSATLESITRDPRTAAAFAARDKKELLATATPLFRRLQSQFHVDHFYFHLPDGINLARVHEPDHDGDRIDRATLRTARQTLKPSSGIEQGPTGNCTLRVVYPCYHDGALIGFIELGTEFETVANRVHDLLHIDLLVAVHKKLLDRGRWEKRNQKLGRQTAWDDFPELVVIDKTLSTLPDPLVATLRSGMPPVNTDAVVDTAGRHLQVVYLPLKDVDGETLGDLIVLRDITDIVAEARRSSLTVAAISLAVGSLLVAFFYAFLGRVGRDLDSRARQLAEANARLEERVRERTEQLEDAHRRLLETARTAGMAEVATGVLHNVGNVLNTVNVSASILADRVRNSEVASFSQLAEMVAARKADLATFLTADERGRLVPDFMSELATVLGREQQDLLQELSTVSTGIDHIKQVISAQQSLAKRANMITDVDPAQVMETAVMMQAESFKRHGIEVVRRFSPTPPARLDEHKVLQILINLISNAAHAVKGKSESERRITLTIEPFNKDGDGDPWLRFGVADTGAGIPADALTRIFAHGFTTRADGHGFGLHSAANAARELGGDLHAHSDGPGRGATFTLTLPAKDAKAVDACNA
jgi:signal transduction histidine kinase